MTTVFVTHCGDCPMLAGYMSTCEHPDAPEPLTKFHSEAADSEAMQTPPPASCPLRGTALKVMIAENAP